MRRLGLQPLLLFALLFIPSVVPGQMPGWKFFLDGDGNTFFLDRNGKIYITEKIKESISPVSVKGLDYYIAAVPDLLREHRTVDALRVIKTVLAMTPADYRIVTAQKRMLLWKHEIIKRNGSRFPLLNVKASPLIFSDLPGVVKIINENMFYSLDVKGQVTVVRNKMRRGPSYAYQGLLFGITFGKDEGEKEGPLFDCLMAVDAEKFAVKTAGVKRIEASWNRRVIPYGGRKEEILGGDKAVLYRLKGNSKVIFSGYEGYIVNGPFGYAFRIITPSEKFEKLDENLKKLALSIKVSRIKN